MYIYMLYMLVKALLGGIFITLQISFIAWQCGSVLFVGRLWYHSILIAFESLLCGSKYWFAKWVWVLYLRVCACLVIKLRLLLPAAFVIYVSVCISTVVLEVIYFQSLMCQLYGLGYNALLIPIVMRYNWQHWYGNFT